MSLATLPSWFLSHGSPMTAVEPSPVGDMWQHCATSLPTRPKAILLVSAHWATKTPTVGGAAQPGMVYDFYGFPPELYTLDYPAPGDVRLAQRVQQLLRDAEFSAELEPDKGLDHAVWVPLRSIYPLADIPVVPLSVQPHLSAAHHLALGRALAVLRTEGVLICASGQMTHNLRAFFSGQTIAPEIGAAFVTWFDENLRAKNFTNLLAWSDVAPFAKLMHPTYEHLLPLFVALGAAGEGYALSTLFEDQVGNFMSYQSYAFI